MIIGIDIGTSNSSICFLNSESKAEPINISTGMSMYGSNFSLPSAVYVEEDGSVLVGQAALNSRLRKPQCFRAEFKRNLGECIPIVLGGRSFFPEELYTELFRHMLSCAQKLGQGTVEKAYITYPASYGKERQDRITTAAKAAGLFDISLVDEPTSAAMHYLQLDLLKDGQTILVYDFGGGTFDVSLMRLKDGIFESLAEPMGLEHCGGIDIDRAIFADILSRVDGEMLRSLQSNPVHRQRLESQIAELAVKAKHHLTASEVFQDYVNVGFDLVEYALTREKLDGMIAGLVQKTIDCCRRIIAEAGLSVDQLDGILLVGGTSRIPLVTQMISQFARKVPVINSADLELAVARGAVYREKRMPPVLETAKETQIIVTDTKSISDEMLHDAVSQDCTTKKSIDQDPLNDDNRKGRFVYLDGWVYYINKVCNEISKMRIDGSEQKTFIQGCWVGSLYAKDEFIYASARESIVRFSVDNGIQEILVHDKQIGSVLFRVIRNTLYYCYKGKNFLYFYDLDNKINRSLSIDREIDGLSVIDDQLYIYSQRRGFAMLNDDRSLSALIEHSVERYTVISCKKAFLTLAPTEHILSHLNDNRSYVLYDQKFNVQGKFTSKYVEPIFDLLGDGECIYVSGKSKDLGNGIFCINQQSGMLTNIANDHIFHNDCTLIGKKLFYTASNSLFSSKNDDLYIFDMQINSKKRILY